VDEKAGRDAYARVTHAAYRLLADRGGGDVVEDGGLLLASGPHPHALIANAAFRLDRRVGADEALGRARRHYAEREFRFSFNTSAEDDADIDQAAAVAGWQRVLDLPGMIVEAPIPDPGPPEGATLRRADPRRDAGSFGDIAAVCFADSDDEAAGYRALFASGGLLDGPACAAWIATAEGRDAAIGWVAVDGDGGLVGWIGTRPEARRRGLGALVTRAATNEAFARGARIVALQASPQGFPVYERLGYRTIAAERIWLPPD
jgi:ribosomal protein S18 acetylase RimI-like enzyme